MRSMVEGHAVLSTASPQALPADLDNPRDRQWHIIQHHFRGNPQRCNPLRPQEMSPRRVRSLGARIVMHPAIDFDRQPRRRAIKIQNIPAGGVLPAEFQPCRPLAQRPPQQGLGQAHFAAKLPGPLYRVAGTGDHRLCPSTTFGGTPPRFGEE